jgi:hypothetical protein
MTAANTGTVQLSDVTFVDKLQGLTASLNSQETVIFRTIVESAALHAEFLQANDEGSEEAAYAKPKAVPANCTVKEEFITLPAKLFK